jgi:endonuclease G, mitochondrial
LKRLVLFLLLFSHLGYAQDAHRDERLLPAHNNNFAIYQYAGYTLQYSEAHEQPLWVAYELTANEVAGTLGRTNDYRRDPAIGTGSAVLKDYSRSGYDRGHLAPAADMRWSPEAMSESFYLSNMSPQVAGFNRGVWRKLEARVRNLASAYGRLWVVTGPVLPRQNTTTIGTSRVTVPDYYYKVLLDPDTGHSAGYLLPNESSSQPLSSFIVTIDLVETKTGIDFFPALGDALEAETESAVTPQYWSETVMAGKPIPLGPPQSITPTYIVPKPPRPTANPDKENIVVYVTRTGKKYHVAGCRSLSRSQIPITLTRAKARYEVCKICNPPK